MTGALDADRLSVRSVPPAEKDGRAEQGGERRSRRTTEGDWLWDGQPDPCPVRALGHDDGAQYFISAQNEFRKVASSALPRIGILADLFGGDMSWPERHFGRAARRGAGGPAVDGEMLAVELIAMCARAGQFDTAISLRGPGVWRTPDGRILVHSGDVLLIDGTPHRPGLKAGTALYRSWAPQQRPALRLDGRGGSVYAGAPADIGQAIVTALGEWRWSRPETEPELFAGGLAHAMLGDATAWHCHLFVRAQSGAGKSTLLRLADAVLGAGSHGVFNNVTAAYVQQALSSQARAICLDEYENDTDVDRLRRLTEMIRLMSDGDGGRGGRGSASGDARDIRLTGSVIMAATLREAMRPQDLNRITMLRALKLYDSKPASNEEMEERAAAMERIEGLIRDFAVHSPALRARMIGGIGLYQENLRLARATLIGWGASQRDATQLGHLLAGFWTLTGDDPADEALRQEARKYLVHLPSAEDEADDDELDPDVRDLLNTLFGSEDHLTWSGGSRQTIGQIVAKARDDTAIEAHAARERLLPLGLRLIKAGDSSLWSQAWLAVANTNKHKALLKIFEGTPYRGGKWAQVLEDWTAASASEKPWRFAGVQSRARLIPAQYLPSADDL